MKTLITTAITILFSASLLAQSFKPVSNTNSYKKVIFHSSKQKPTNTVSSLAKEIYETQNFEYRTFLKDAGDSRMCYPIGEETYSKKELTKVFRKGAGRAENVFEFEKFLKERNPKILSNVSRREVADIYTKLREGTLNAYLDTLPSGIFSTE